MSFAELSDNKKKFLEAWVFIETSNLSHCPQFFTCWKEIKEICIFFVVAYSQFTKVLYLSSSGFNAKCIFIPKSYTEAFQNLLFYQLIDLENLAFIYSWVEMFNIQKARKALHWNAMLHKITVRNAFFLILIKKNKCVCAYDLFLNIWLTLLTKNLFSFINFF